MTIRKLRELIRDLPDDMRIYADDGSHGMFSDNNEYLTLLTQKGNSEMCILQTRNDFETPEELNAWYNWVIIGDRNELDFWTEFIERGYEPEDFGDEDRIKMAYEKLKKFRYA